MDKAPLVHHEEAVRDASDLLGLVGDDDDRASLLEPGEDGADVVAVLGVETGEGLIKEEDLRVVERGEADEELALEAERERAERAVRDVGDSERAEGLLPADGGSTASPPREPVEDAEELGAGEGVREGVDLGAVADGGVEVSDALFGEGVVDDEVALRLREDASHDLHKRGLARSVLAEDDGELVLEELEGDVVESAEVVPALGEATHGVDDSFGAL